MDIILHTNIQDYRNLGNLGSYGIPVISCNTLFINIL